MSVLKRVGTAVFLVPVVVLFVMFSNRLVFSIFVMALGTVFAFEFFWNVAPLPRLEKVFSLVVTPLYLGLFARDMIFDAILFICIAFLTYLSFSIFISNDRWHSGGIMAVFFLYVVVSLSILFKLWMVFGKWKVVFLLTSVWVGDVMAYFVGIRWGKRPLFPRVSPKKTWEGLFGGLLGVFIANAIMGPFVLKVGVPGRIIIFLSMAVPSIFGDLVESSMKRASGIKDSSGLLPGHGGFLDRFDGFVFSVPFFYAALRLVC